MADGYQRELEVAIEAVCEAARLCRTVQQQTSAGKLEKDDRSPVTVADFGSQALVCRRLKQAFASDPIIAEEDSAELRKAEREAVLAEVAGHVARLVPGAEPLQVCDWIDGGNAGEYSDRFWTLDPIDGTKGFLRGEQYAVALALIVDGTIQVAALACPNLPTSAGGDTIGSVFTAIRGGPARVRPIDGNGEAVEIRASDLADVTGARLCESVEKKHSAHGKSGQLIERLSISGEPVRIDSQAKYATVARGEADVYLRLPTRPDYREKIWDHAAGVLVVEAAGGKVTDVNGRTLDFTRGQALTENAGVIVTNGKLHDVILEGLAQLA